MVAPAVIQVDPSSHRVPAARILLGSRPQVGEARRDRRATRSEVTAQAVTGSPVRSLAVAVVVAAVGLVAQAANPAAPEDWASADVQHLADLARQFHAEMNQDPLQRLATHVAERYRQVRPVGRPDWNQWVDLPFYLGTWFPAETQGMMAQEILRVFGPNEAEVVKLEHATVARVVRALCHLRDLQAASFISCGWIAGSDKYKLAPIDSLVDIAQPMKFAGSKDTACRIRLMEHLTSSYLSNSARTKSVSCRRWHVLAKRLVREMSADERRSWATRLRAAFADSHAVLDKLGDGQVVYLVEALTSLGDSRAGETLLGWLDRNKAWKSYSPDQLLLLAESLHRLKGAGAGHRQALVDYIEAKYITDDAAAKLLSPRHWNGLAYYLKQELSHEARALWAAKIWSAYTDGSAAIERLSQQDKLNLAGVLRKLTDDEGARALAKWVDESAGWMELQPRALASMARWFSSVDGAGAAASARLAEHITNLCLADEATVRAVPLVDWKQLAAHLSSHLEPSMRRAWLVGLLKAFAGSTEALSSLTSDEVACLIETFEALGDEQLPSMVQAEWRWHRGAGSGPHGRFMPGQIWDAKLLLLLRRVITATPDEQEQIWARGVRLLPRRTESPSNAAVREVNEFIAALEGSSGISPRMVADDLSRLCLDNSVWFKLRARLHVYELEERAKAAPGELQALLEKAKSLGASGRTEQAILLYCSIIEDNPNDRKTAALIRWVLLPLLLGREQMDLADAQAHLDALRGEDVEVSADLWNFACQLLFRRVAAVPAEQRKDTWAWGMQQFAENDHIRLCEETLARLDGLCERLGPDGSLTSGEVLTDLLVLIPDLESMRQIQRRRTATFVGTKNWRDALASVNVQIILAAATPEGPEEATQHLLDIQKLAGAAHRQVNGQSAVEALDLTEPDGNTGGSSTETQPSYEATILGADGLLAATAARFLKQRGSFASPRRRAFLSLFAGNSTEALRNVHAALAQTCAQLYEVSESFDDIVAVLGVVDGGYHSACRFAKWLALGGTGEGTLSSDALDPALGLLVGCEAAPCTAPAPCETSSEGPRPEVFAALPRQVRNRLASQWLLKQQERYLRWAMDCLAEGRVLRAASYWACAINAAPGPEDAATMIKTVCKGAEGIIDSQEAMAALAETVCFVGSAQRRRLLLIQMASLLHNDGEYASCLEILDKADSSAEGAEVRRDMTAGLLRASSLIRMGRLDEAKRLLESTQDWQGTKTQCARGSFLVAWVYLKEGKMQDAIPALERITEQYPGTPPAQKAKSILENLRSR